MLQIIIALVLFVHGIGHVMGIMAMAGLSTIETWNARSWLLTGILGDTVSRVIGFLLFAVALIGFVGAALAVMDWLVPHEWWQTLVLFSSIVSLAAIALYWNAFVALFPNKIGVIAVDAAVLLGLLVFNWPTEAQLGF
jgi:hypothetical protein